MQKKQKKKQYIYIYTINRIQNIFWGYVIYVCVLCIFIMYIQIHTNTVYFENIYMYIFKFI